MDGKRKKPAVRFAGFTGDWEQRKLSELGQIMTGSTPSTSKSEYYSEDGIPWVTPTDIESTTISNTPRRLSKEGAKVGRVVPANTILCTCIASIGKNTLLTVKGSFNQQINSLTPYDENDAYFLLTESELWSDKMKRMAASGTMQIVNKTVFSELQTMVPKKAEQQQIGEYFKNLDHLITLHQRKYDALVNTKKSMLQKMFPQNGETVPEIRFAGFTGDWEQRKLRDVAPLQRGFDLPTSQMKEGNYPVVMSNGIGGYHNDYKVNGPGVVTGRSGTIGKVHYIEGNYWPHNTSLWVTDFKNNYPKYIYHLYHWMDFSQYGTGSGVPTLNRNDIHDSKLYIPTMDEQIKISSYFDNLDNLITLQQHKLEKLKQLKQSMLEKMFV